MKAIILLRWEKAGCQTAFVELNAEELLRDLEDFIVCHEEP
jgi:hypothetical protein